VSDREWQYIKHETNKSVTVRDSAPQKWLFMFNIESIEYVFQGITCVQRIPNVPPLTLSVIIFTDSLTVFIIS
jgi:hypothetical protein